MMLRYRYMYFQDTQHANCALHLLAGCQPATAALDTATGSELPCPYRKHQRLLSDRTLHGYWCMFQNNQQNLSRCTVQSGGCHGQNDTGFQGMPGAGMHVLGQGLGSAAMMSCALQVRLRPGRHVLPGHPGDWRAPSALRRAACGSWLLRPVPGEER